MKIKIMKIIFFNFLIPNLCEYKAPKLENKSIENIIVEEEKIIWPKNKTNFCIKTISMNK